MESRNKQKNPELLEKEIKLVVTRGEEWGRWGELEGCGQRYKLPVIKYLNKYEGYNVQHVNYSTIYRKVVKRVNPVSFHPTEIFLSFLPSFRSSFLPIFLLLYKKYYVCLMTTSSTHFGFLQNLA